MFDNVCKFLAETFPADFATWLLGEPVPLTELSPSELSLEPIRADALILRQSEQVVLHVEFQTEPKANIPFRMADYRLRVYRRFPEKQMRQVVVYLQSSKSDLVRQTAFVLENTRHEFQVVRLWEQPIEPFLQAPGLLPFAVLSGTDNPAQALQEVARQIETISDLRVQSNVTASAAILAGLVLDKEQVQRLLRRDLMRESVIYQDILQEGELSLVFRQLTRRVGSVPAGMQAQVQALSRTQLEDLGEALLDFSELEDLVGWFKNNASIVE